MRAFAGLWRCLQLMSNPLIDYDPFIRGPFMQRTESSCDGIPVTMAKHRLLQIKQIGL